MSNIRITKQFSFETGHALYGYDGKCKNIHGHSYQLFVTVIGDSNITHWFIRVFSMCLTYHKVNGFEHEVKIVS